jgi:hypothetical protein
LHGSSSIAEQASLTSVRTSDAIFGNVNEALRVEHHVLHIFDRGLLSLYTVSEMQMLARVASDAPERLWH